MEILDWFGGPVRANETREEFEALIEKMKQDERCEFLIWRDSSRLFRDQLRTWNLEGDLERNGIRLFDDCSNIDWTDELTPDKVWRKGISRLQAEAASVQYRDWTMKSMAYHCHQRDPRSGWCYKLGGVPKLGYRTVKVDTERRDKRGNLIQRAIWELDEDTCILVPRMWLDWYCEEKLGDDQIARRLTQMGIRSTRGKAISHSTVRQWRQPESLLTYAGYYLWNKNSVHRLGRKNPMKRKPEYEWEVVENAHPAILTMDEVKRIEDEAENRRQKWSERTVSPRSRHNKHFSLTGGLAKCTACNSNIVGIRYNHDCHRGYYICGTYQYRAGEGCGPRWSVKSPAIDTELLKGAVHLFPVSPHRVEKWADQANRLLLDSLGDTKQQETDLDRRIDEIDNQITNLVEAIKDGLSVGGRLRSEIQQLQSKQESLRHERSQLSHRAIPLIQPEHVLGYYRRLDNAAYTENEEERRDVIRSVCDSVRADPYEKSVAVDYNFSGIACTNYVVAPTGFGAMGRIAPWEQFELQCESGARVESVVQVVL